MKAIANRRTFLRQMGRGLLGGACLSFADAHGAAKDRPNIILCMADDMGWGDTGYNGHPLLKTPNLDAMAASGVRFERFYSGSPVCSPTRGSVITGRHPYRYGVVGANKGHMPPEEVTLAEALKGLGYRTGHFGKWHLGTLTKTLKESNRGGPRGIEDYSPPWVNGFDVCFSTEAKVPTANPMVDPVTGKDYNTHYWNEQGEMVRDNLQGDDSRIIMDRAIPFVRDAAKKEAPFLAVIWFHAPHEPVEAEEKHRALYADQSDQAQRYYGCISALDEQMGRLRSELRGLGVADNTALWFCSDNGPEWNTGTKLGSAKHLRGSKRDVYEGGIRVPGLLEWPAKLPTPKTIDMPCATLDYFATTLDMVGLSPDPYPHPADGVSMLPALEGRMKERAKPLLFELHDRQALLENRFKLLTYDAGKTYQLYDILNDPSETTDLAVKMPERVAAMKKTLNDWRASCEQSQKGADYKEAR
jgi:arylsulfatase A-like enzyme